MHSCNNTVAPGITVCSNCPSSTAAHARSHFRHSFTAPSIMRWSRRSHSFTMRWRSSSNFANLPLVVDPLLHDSPYRIVDGVKIRTIRRPQTWLDEIRRDFFQQLDRLGSCVSWRSILLEDEILRILSDFRQHWQIIYNVYHDGNSCWLLKTVVSTVSENLMPKVHNL